MNPHNLNNLSREPTSVFYYLLENIRRLESADYDHKLTHGTHYTPRLPIPIDEAGVIRAGQLSYFAPAESHYSASIAGYIYNENVDGENPAVMDRSQVSCAELSKSEKNDRRLRSAEDLAARMIKMAKIAQVYIAIANGLSPEQAAALRFNEEFISNSVI